MRVLWVIGLLALGAGCVDRSTTPTTPAALEIGTNQTIFAATTRAREQDGTFADERSDRLHLLELTVSIPPSHMPGDLNFAYANPDPETQFTMAGRREFATPGDFRARINQTLAALPPAEREVTVFVHGYNSTQPEAAFRAAQLANDVNLPGATVIYSWPSRGRPLGYVYDNDSLLFARDGLETLLREMRKTHAKRIVLIAHSLGSLLSVEALRQIEIGDPGWAARNLGGVVLISPDINVDVFREDMGRFRTLPSPFIVFVSSKDPLLNISARLRGGGKRLGNIEGTGGLEGLPIEIVDTTAFSKTAYSPHFTAATSPALIAMLNQASAINRTFGAEQRTLLNYLPGGGDGTQGVTRLVLSPAEDERR